MQPQLMDFPEIILGAEDLGLLHRHAGRRRPLPAAPNRLSIVDVAESPEPPDSERSVEQRLVVDEMNACVRKVIDSLPEDYRAALVLHDLEGLTAAQTAEISGCELPTAKIRIHRARLRLAEALRQECEFYRDDENVLRCDPKKDGPPPLSPILPGQRP